MRYPLRSMAYLVAVCRAHFASLIVCLLLLIPAVYLRAQSSQWLSDKNSRRYGEAYTYHLRVGKYDVRISQYLKGAKCDSLSVANLGEDVWGSFFIRGNKVDISGERYWIDRESGSTKDWFIVHVGPKANSWKIRLDSWLFAFSLTPVLFSAAIVGVQLVRHNRSEGKIGSAVSDRRKLEP